MKIRKTLSRKDWNTCFSISKVTLNALTRKLAAELKGTNILMDLVDAG
jgi:short-subunit dehydrogenase